MALPHEVMTRGLVVARYLYESGVQQSYQAGFRRATAVLTFHDAVEMLLVLGLQHHDLYNPKKLYNFAEYWTVFETNQTPLTQFGAMQRLNTARVNLKHHASLPGPDTVEEARVQSRIFFVENTPIVFGENFEEISLSSLVASDQARAHLETADRNMTAGDYDAAIVEIAYALHRLLWTHASRRDPSHLRSSPPHLDSSVFVQVKDVRAQMELRRFVNETTQAITESQENIHFINLGLRCGLDFGRWERFRALTPRTTESITGELRRTARRGQPPATADQCRFCYDFVIDSALRVQELGM